MARCPSIGPDQGAYGLRVDEVRVEGDSLILSSDLLRLRLPWAFGMATGKILGHP